MGVSKNMGVSKKWMVYFMGKPIKMDDLGVPLFLETSIMPLYDTSIFKDISNIKYYTMIP